MKAESINEKLAAEKAELEESLARGDEVVQEMLGKVNESSESTSCCYECCGAGN